MINFTKKRILLISAIASIFHFSIHSLAFAMDENERERHRPNIKAADTADRWIDVFGHGVQVLGNAVQVAGQAAQVYGQLQGPVAQIQPQRAGAGVQRQYQVRVNEDYNRQQHTENRIQHLENQTREINKRVQINSDFNFGVALKNQFEEEDQTMQRMIADEELATKYQEEEDREGAIHMQNQPWR